MSSKTDLYEPFVLSSPLSWGIQEGLRNITRIPPGRGPGAVQLAHPLSSAHPASAPSSLSNCVCQNSAVDKRCHYLAGSPLQNSIQSAGCEDSWPRSQHGEHVASHGVHYRFGFWWNSALLELSVQKSVLWLSHLSWLFVLVFVVVYSHALLLRYGR